MQADSYEKRPDGRGSCNSGFESVKDVTPRNDGGRPRNGAQRTVGRKIWRDVQTLNGLTKLHGYVAPRRAPAVRSNALRIDVHSHFHPSVLYIFRTMDMPQATMVRIVYQDRGRCFTTGHLHRRQTSDNISRESQQRGWRALLSFYACYCYSYSRERK